MRSVMETVPELAAETGLGLAGGVLLFLVATPTGRKWLQTGAVCCSRGAGLAGGAIASLFNDLRTGWAELYQEVRHSQSGGVQRPGEVH